MRQLNRKNVGITGPMPGYSHCDGVWFEPDKHASYQPLAKAICQHFKPANVLELGGGAGSLAAHIRSEMPFSRVVTVDGNPDTLTSPYIVPENHFVCRTDQEIILMEGEYVYSFDLLLSFEHFEHVQDSSFPIFLNNLIRHAAHGAVLMATAANWRYPGGSDIHCNVKSREEWDALLQSNGFTPLPITIITQENKPFNFGMGATSELIYRFPD